MNGAQKPHLLEFFLYLLLIVGVLAIFVWLFSKPTAQLQKDLNQQSQTSAQQMNTKQYKKAPEMQITTNKKYFAQVMTAKGTFTIELFSRETPTAVNNFVFLARAGFYDGTVFHRIIKDFMIQGGDPKGDGTGGPGYTFADEKISRDYKQGVVAMANRGPDTNGSQFFIMHKDYDLPKQYVIFGQVTEGLETIEKIAQTPVIENAAGEKSKPAEEVRIEKIVINEN